MGRCRVFWPSMWTASSTRIAASIATGMARWLNRRRIAEGGGGLAIDVVDGHHGPILRDAANVVPPGVATMETQPNSRPRLCPEEMTMSRHESFRPYTAPAGGWGSARSLGQILSAKACSPAAPLVLAGRTSPTASCASAAPGPSRRTRCRSSFARTAPRRRLGADHPPLHAGFLRQAHGHRTAGAGTTTISSRPAA